MGAILWWIVLRIICDILSVVFGTKAIVCFHRCETKGNGFVEHDNY
jgi:hypothetical protein